MRHALLAVVLVVVGCGDDDGSTPATDAGSDTGQPAAPAESCAQPGDRGNDIGVGEFCTPAGTECRSFSRASLCLAAVAPEENQWFCTRLCSSDDQCGTDAVCGGDTRGSACIPARCAPERPDAGPASDSGPPDDGGTPPDAG